jgi:hypothetical protein
MNCLPKAFWSILFLLLFYFFKFVNSVIGYKLWMMYAKVVFGGGGGGGG